MSKRKNSQVWISAEKQRKINAFEVKIKKRERDGSKMLSTTSNGYF
jgi:hypothetical protein